LIGYLPHSENAKIVSFSAKKKTLTTPNGPMYEPPWNGETGTALPVQIQFSEIYELHAIRKPQKLQCWASPLLT